MSERIFPVAYGNEEELSLMWRHVSASNPTRLEGRSMYLEYPDGLQEDNTFLSNGGRLYWDYEHLESATPECADIEDLVVRIHASEALIVHLLKAHTNLNRHHVLLFNRRVIDAHGNSWSMHDDFGFSARSPVLYSKNRHRVLLGHLASRSFVTGAGFVSDNAYYFAQKASKYHSKEMGYGHQPFMMRFAPNSLGNMDRVEVRSGDVNLSDWAVRERVGMAAIALAVQQTRHARLIPYVEGPRTQLNERNRLQLNDDGTILRTPAVVAALDYERHLSEAGSKLAEEYEHMPQELIDINEQNLLFCEDFDKVTRGEATIKSLCGRADWADKFAYILKVRQRDIEREKKRTPYDAKERAIDILYSQIEIASNSSSKSDEKKSMPTSSVEVRYGWGYQLQRDTHGHRPQATVVERAMLTPPNTRARKRAELLKDGYQIKEWDVATLDEETFLHQPDPRASKAEWDMVRRISQDEAV